MDQGRPVRFFGIVVLFVLQPLLAQSQPATETAPFNERWNVPPPAVSPAATPGLNPPTAPEPVESRGSDVRGTQPASAQAPFKGRASFYSYSHGRTANGNPYNLHRLTAAHRTLPFGTRLRVTDTKTNRTVDVVVNDRGPFIRNRVIDLSLGAAKVLGMTERGIAQVSIEVLGRPEN